MAELRFKPNSQRSFYLAIFSTLVVLFFIRYLLIPRLCGKDCEQLLGNKFFLAAKITEDLFTSSVVTILIGSFVFWLSAPAKERSLHVLTQSETRRYFDQALDETDFWHYKGGTGTFMRAKILPMNAKLARERNEYRTVFLDIIDPTDLGVCERYSTHRRGLRIAKLDDSSLWACERVRHESYATILSACVLKTAEPQLKVRIGLSRVMSTYRYDVSADTLLITREQDDASALRAKKGTEFYSAFRAEVEIAFQQARLLDLDSCAGLSMEDVSPDGVKSLFERLGIATPDLNPSDYDNIILRFQNPRPYFT